MARALDHEKRREWAKRFERFRASGTTVAHFCGHERVTVNTFYYWSKRVGSAAALEQRHVVGAEFRKTPASHGASTRHDVGGRADAKAAAEGLVRFRFGSVEVDVPAGCLDVVRCLAESAGRSGTQVARSTPGAFHEIVLGTRR
jgi:hypothetical protein